MALSTRHIPFKPWPLLSDRDLTIIGTATTRTLEFTTGASSPDSSSVTSSILPLSTSSVSSSAAQNRRLDATTTTSVPATSATGSASSPSTISSSQPSMTASAASTTSPAASAASSTPMLSSAASSTTPSAATTFGWTTIPITDAPTSSLDPTEFQSGAEWMSAIAYYEHSLTNDPQYASMQSEALSAGLQPNPKQLALSVIQAFPTQPPWFQSAPPDLQSYVASIAMAEQSLILDDPTPTGSASYNADVLSSMAAMMGSLHAYEEIITRQESYISMANVAATATGLDHIEPSRDPLSLAKALEAGPTPTWFTQMPAPLQTFVRDIAADEAKIYLGQVDAAPHNPAAATAGVPTPASGTDRPSRVPFSALVVAGMLCVAALL